jgi:hypothetical protein
LGVIYQWRLDGGQSEKELIFPFAQPCLNVLNPHWQSSNQLVLQCNQNPNTSSVYRVSYKKLALVEAQFMLCLVAVNFLNK